MAALSWRKNDAVYFLLILLAGLLLRMIYLGQTSLGFDEGLDMLNASTQGIGLRNLMQTPYLHTIFLYYWKGMGGSEFMLRLPSVFFSMATIIICYFFSRLVLDKRVALIASFLLAVSPLHIHYAQQTRPYSLVSLMTLAAGYCLVKGVKEGKLRYWLGFSVSLAVSVYAHYTALFMVFVYALFFLLQIKKHLSRRWSWYIANLLLLFLLWPAINLFATSSYFYVKHWWISPVNLFSVPIILMHFSVGYNASLYVYIVLTAIYCLAAVYGILCHRDKENMFFIVFGWLVPIGIIFIVGLVKPSLFCVDRYVLPASLFFYILIAGGLSAIKKKYLTVLFLVTISIVSALALKNHYAHYFPLSVNHRKWIQLYKDTRSAAFYILKQFKDRDKICFIEENMIPQLRYYFSRAYLEDGYNEKAYAQFSSQEHFLGVFEQDKQTILKYNPQTRKTMAFFFDLKATLGLQSPTDLSFAHYKRMWLIVPPYSNVSRIVGHLDKKMIFQSLAKFPGVWVYLFAIS